jgi:hypothetical protein
MTAAADISLAVKFLRLLDAEAAKTGCFTYQTFHDTEAKEKDPSLAHIIPGPARSQLLELHERGAGIYVTVNETADKAIRRDANIIRIRAVWREADAADLPELPIEPSLIVETSPGHFHEYFLVADDWPADEQGRADFKAVMERMVKAYGSDPGAKDLPRVLRVPGFWHRKHEPHLVHITKPNGSGEEVRRYTRAEILAAFPPVEQPKKKDKPQPRDWLNNELDEIERARDALNFIRPDDRKIWLDVGMALNDCFGDGARRLWDQWSAGSIKYDAHDQEKNWRSFGRRTGITIATLFHYAQQAGWRGNSGPHFNGNKQQQSAEPGEEPSGGKDNAKDNTFNAQRLNQMTFAPIKYVVHGYIVEGLTLFAGKPKIGKSWLLLHAAFAVAEGGLTLGNAQCEQGDVLYCALEDNQRRLQSRMTKLFGTQGWPARLNFTCEMPRLTEGGLDFIKSWIESAAGPRLVIIDTLAMVRMPNRKDTSTYDADYAAVKDLRDVALKYGIAIVLVHHLRKAEADDAFDTISGTLGLTGAPDTIMILRRDTRGTILHAKGRDLIEIEKAIRFDAGTCTWVVLGEAEAIRQSAERSAIVAALEEAGTELGPNQIATACGMKPANVRYLLAKQRPSSTSVSSARRQRHMDCPALAWPGAIKGGQ